MYIQIYYWTKEPYKETSYCEIKSMLTDSEGCLRRFHKTRIN